MTEREQKIRELIARLLARPGISREFTILNMSDAEFLLAELSHERATGALFRTQLEAMLLERRMPSPTWWLRVWFFLKGTTA